jgi:GMP synthase-like glutamine amidotransferase
MKLCILDNDVLDPAAEPIWGSYAAMFERLLRGVGFEGEVAVFSARHGQYPTSFESYDAVLLTGSRADAFSSEPWVVALQGHVSDLLAQEKKLIGVCFGHQLVAHCLGAPVGRAAQGWGVGRTTYAWHEPQLFCDLPEQVSLLASHQDQVLELPEGATLLASNAHCPVAAYSISEQVLCVQPHPEFDTRYAAFLLGKRRAMFGEAVYQDRVESLQEGHDGIQFAAFMLRFIYPDRASA